MSRQRSRSMFLVERYWPGVTLADVHRAAERTETTATTGEPGGGVRYLGSVLIEDEETVFSLFHATDVTAVADANRRGGFRYDRIRPVAADPSSATSIHLACHEEGATP